MWECRKCVDSHFIPPSSSTAVNIKEQVGDSILPFSIIFMCVCKYIFVILHGSSVRWHRESRSRTHRQVRRQVAERHDAAKIESVMQMYFAYVYTRPGREAKGRRKHSLPFLNKNTLPK